MSTSMPYRARITVTSDHVRTLRENGPRTHLTWNEDTHTVEVVSANEALRPNHMIITGPHGPELMAAEYSSETGEVSDDDIARDLSDIATDWYADWPGIRAMNLHLEGLRSHLLTRGAYIDAAPMFEQPFRGLPRMTDFYRQPGEMAVARVTVTCGFLEPTLIVTDTANESTWPVSEISMALGGTFSQARVAELIAATVIHTLDLA